MKWISVDEEMPERLVKVIIYDHDGFGVICSKYCDYGWVLENKIDQQANVTHWMRLP